MSAAGCPTCGHDMDSHNVHVRFALPEVLLRSDPAPPTRMSGRDAGASVMLDAEGVGAFLRALLPVHLTGGYTVTYGVWVQVSTEDLHRAFECWRSPDYPQLALSGHLANRVDFADVLGAPVDLCVRDPEHTPYCQSSADPALGALMSQQWDHARVLETLPTCPARPTTAAFTG